MEHFEEHLWQVFQDFFENRIINKHTNGTYICLILKKNRETKVSDYRHISLVTFPYKIIAKVLSRKA